MLLGVAVAIDIETLDENAIHSSRPRFAESSSASYAEDSSENTGFRIDYLAPFATVVIAFELRASPYRASLPASSR